MQKFICNTLYKDVKIQKFFDKLFVIYENISSKIKDEKDFKKIDLKKIMLEHKIGFKRSQQNRFYGEF